jgi:hypothetical protein
MDVRPTTLDTQDDLLELNHLFSLSIHYNDISQQEDLKEMMQRWPLLAEITQF